MIKNLISGVYLLISDLTKLIWQYSFAQKTSLLLRI